MVEIIWFHHVTFIYIMYVSFILSCYKWICYPYIALYYQSLVIASNGSWSTQVFQMTPYSTIWFFRKVTLAIITTDCIGKVFKYWEAAHGGRYNFPQIVSFSFKVERRDWQQMLSVVCPETIVFLNSFWRKMCAEHLSLKFVCQSNFYIKIFHKKTNLAHCSQVSIIFGADIFSCATRSISWMFPSCHILDSNDVCVRAEVY